MGLGAVAVIGAVGGIVSTGVSVAGAVKSFQDADEQADIAKKAERDAKKAMARAKDRIEMDEYAGLTMPMDAYREQRDLLSQSQQQNVRALQEQDRPGAGIGAVGMAANVGTEKIRTDMGKDIFALDKMKADSRTDINQQLADMDLGFARDQNLRRAEADRNKAALMTSGFENINQAIQTGSQELPLYIKSGGESSSLKLGEKYREAEGFDKLTPVEQRAYFDAMSREDRKKFASKDIISQDVIFKDGKLQMKGYAEYYDPVRDISLDPNLYNPDGTLKTSDYSEFGLGLYDSLLGQQ